MKILVVEDDQSVAQALQILFSGYSYVVDIAADGEAGLQMAEAFTYDLILMDLLLPKLDGVSICRHLRDKGFRNPILLLTGQAEGRQKAIALNAGADDYVVKPFDAEELVARVQALLRRSGSLQQATLTWGNLSLDPSSHKVAYGTQLMAVTPKEYAILELFLRHPHRILSAAAMLDHVWDSVEPPGEEAVRVHIKELRHKLTAVGAPKDFIKTVYRVGYQLNPVYSDFLAVQVGQQPTVPQIAELAMVNEELRVTLEEWQTVQEALRRQNAELRSTQQSLELERQRYRDLFEFAPDAYFVTDVHGAIQEVNSAASNLLHVDPNYLIGKSLVVFVAQPDRRDFRLRLAQFNFAENWEVYVKPRDGDLVPVLVAVTPIQDLQNEIVGLRWSLRDIRLRKQMEQQLQAANDQLEMRVAERTAELTLANQALQQREEFLSSIYNGADEAIFVIEVTEANDFHFVSFNKRAEQYGGVTQQEIQGKTPEAAFGATIGASFRQHYEHCLQVGSSTSYEEHLLFGDRDIWTLTTLSPIRDETGRIYRIVGTAIDITDRKQAEIALRDSEQQFRNMADYAPVIVWVTDAAANCTYLSQTWYDLTGQPEGGGFGLGWLEAVHPDDRERARSSFLSAHARRERYWVEYRLCRKDGGYCWVLDTARPWIGTDGQFKGYIGSATNISDRKQLELSLQASEVKLNQVINNVSASIVSLRVFADRTVQYDYCSTGCEVVFGYTAAEIMEGAWWAGIPPEDQESVILAAQDAIFAGDTQCSLHMEYRFRHKDGTWRWISSDLSSCRDEQNDCWQMIAVDTDITDRKQLELALHTTQTKLSQVLDGVIAAIVSFRVYANRDWEYEYCSPGCAKLFGYSLEAFADKHFWMSQVLPEDREQVIIPLFDRFFAEQDAIAEYRFRCQDGTIRWFSSSYSSRKVTDDCWIITTVNYDITSYKQLEAERQQAELVLQKREEQLRLALDLNSVGMWEWQIATGTCTWNDHNYRLLGYEPGEVEPSHQLWHSHVHPDDVEMVDQKLRQALANKTEYEAEFRVVLRDGTIGWELGKGQGIYDETGQPVRMVGVAFNITDRKRHEANAAFIVEIVEDFLRLSSADEIMQTVSAKLGIYLGSSSCFLVAVNEAQDRAIVEYGWHTADIPDVTGAYQLSELIPEALQQTAQAGETIVIPDIQTDPRTNQKHYLDTACKIHAFVAVPFHQAGEWTYLFTVNDSAPREWRKDEIELIREVAHRSLFRLIRARAEAALRESEQQYRQILDSIADIVIVKQPDSRIVWANRAFRDYYGMTLEDLQGIIDASFNEPDYTRQYVHDDAFVFMTGQTLAIPEEPVTRHDGVVRIFNTIKAPIFDEAGQVVLLVGVCRDITDRKQAELTLQQQVRREQLMADISQDIRQSLDLNQVLSRTVERVRELLNTDRVIIFRFRPDWQGEVIMESVGAGWASIVSTTIYDPCFVDQYIEPYRQGRIVTLHDINGADLQPCYVELLQHFQVKANLVVPILQGEKLWGLLIAHHCSAPRQWQLSEIDLLRQLATQVGIAIQQSELYQQTHLELLERKRMQAVLEESEERFRTLNATAPIGICQTDASGICLYTNIRWQEMSGLSFEESLGDGWLQAVHPEDREAIASAWEAYLQGGSEYLPEYRLLTPQGEIRWVAAKVATMKSVTGEVIGYVGIDLDITDRKLAEQQIRQQAALLDITSDAILVRDLDHRILYWNKGAERLYGWTASEAVGQLSEELLHNDASQTAEIIQILLAQGKWRGEIQKTTKTGKVVEVEGRWTLVRNEAGQPQFILSVDTDITEKKQLEAQFYRAQRLESLGTLASGIAHDLNNVLTPMLAIAQLLRLKETNLGTRSQEMLKVLEDSAKRGAEMIKQILTFTRGTGGERQSVQVVSLLQEVIHVIQQTFPKSIRIHHNISDHSSYLVAADSTYLHQILMNLCVNARDAMPNGGVLSFSVEYCVVDQAFTQINLDAQVGDYVVITVADTGTGIPPEVRDRIFDPFFTTKEQGQGTGLGLATVLGIVKNYGGFLQVFSEVGQGTQFKVYLPAIKEAPTGSSYSQSRLTGNGELVLLVDDDVAVQCSTQSLLEDHQITVLSTHDGMEAIALYKQHQAEVSVVILDIMMPNMNGFTLIQKLKEINPFVKIIAISGLPTNREPALTAGATAFLAKPYSMDDLMNMLQALLSNL